MRAGPTGGPLRCSQLAPLPPAARMRAFSRRGDRSASMRGRAAKDPREQAPTRRRLCPAGTDDAERTVAGFLLSRPLAETLPPPHAPCGGIEWVRSHGKPWRGSMHPSARTGLQRPMSCGQRGSPKIGLPFRWSWCLGPRCGPSRPWSHRLPANTQACGKEGLPHGRLRRP